jgi:uncharacterized protein (TIGR02147 family)
MQTNEPFYRFKLKETLLSRKRKNPQYSLRAFARELEIDSSNLSSILTKKRGIPKHRVQAIIDKLQLSPLEEELFKASTIRKKNAIDSIKVEDIERKYLLDQKYYKVTSEWDYYAFLQLITIKNIPHDMEYLAIRLGIQKERILKIVKDLEDLKFIASNPDGTFTRKVPSLETSEEIENKALQASHQEALKLASEKLINTDVKQRDFSSVTMAINPDRLPEAKAIIREFQEKLYALLADGLQTEVYQFNCQLFPLTHKDSNYEH